MILKTRTRMIPECRPKCLQRNNGRLAITRRLGSLEELPARIDTDRMTGAAGLGADGIHRTFRSREKRARNVGPEMLFLRHGNYAGGMLPESVHQGSNALSVKSSVNVIRDEKHLVRSGINGNVTTEEASLSAGCLDCNLCEQITLLVVRECKVLRERTGEIIARLCGPDHPVEIINWSLIRHLHFLSNVKSDPVGAPETEVELKLESLCPSGSANCSISLRFFRS